MKYKGDELKAEDGLGIFMSAYDWQQAMYYAKFKFGDIKEILYTKEGENDGEHWKVIVLLKDLTYGWLNAWCDYSGWDCQSGGTSGICTTYEEAKLEVELNAIQNK